MLSLLCDLISFDRKLTAVLDSESETVVNLAFSHNGSISLSLNGMIELWLL